MSERMPKAAYFHKRYKEALQRGDTRKAAYYERRLKEMGVYQEMTDKVIDRTRDRIAKMPSAERIKRAVGIINETKSGFSQQQKQAYLMDAGLTFDEYLEALNQATSGGLVKAALGE